MIREMLDRFIDKRQAYRSTFLRTTDGKPDRATQAVLQDLSKFCRANRTTITHSPVTGLIDSHAMAVAEGRREVFMRIAKFIHLSDADVARMLENEGANNHG